MSRKMTSEDQAVLENAPITYYFTMIFAAFGTMLAFYYLYEVMEKVNVFLFFLSVCGGGIPVGFIGVFIDYKMLQNRLKKR